MINLTDHIALHELAWVVINVIGLVINILAHKHASKKKKTFSQGDIPYLFPARGMMVAQNIRNTRGRMLFNVAFLTVGAVAMRRLNQPFTPTTLVYTVALFVVAGGFVYLDVLEHLERKELDEMIKEGRHERRRSDRTTEVVAENTRAVLENTEVTRENTEARQEETGDSH